MKWLHIACVPLATAFYLPGVAPIEYEEGAAVELKVNKLTSSKTQLPYEYYTLPYCKPDTVKKKVENIGEILTGDIIETSPYEIYMLQQESCKTLCTVKLKPKGNREKFRNMIEEEYVVNMIVDNLPAAVAYQAADPNAPVVYMAGFPAGTMEKGHYFVHNHLSITLKYHSDGEKYEGYRIVGFEIQPKSSAKDCESAPFDLDAADKITYTYDVFWSQSDVKWASRWDVYLKMQSAEIHWFSLLNSVLIVVFLTAMVAMILLRTVHRDISRYNELVTEEEAAEETGWKLVHADVFRKPKASILLSVSVGSGLQVLFMSVVTLGFALLGFLSPAHRGSLLQTTMLIYTFMGFLGGYTAAMCCKVFNPEEPRTSLKSTIVLTASLYPGIIFTVFFFINLLIWSQGSSGAVPFGTLFSILTLWFGISVPLCFLGAHFGNRRAAIELPVRTNKIPRRVPEQSWPHSLLLACLIGGILPFGAAFTEVFFIMLSLWHHRYYYLFGFLGLVLVIVVTTCAEISMTLTYFQLTSENHHWWWRAFIVSSSSGGYQFLYSIFYFAFRLQINMFVSTVVYFGYMFVISLLFGLLTGSVGLVASFFFVRAIYGSIKVD